MHILKKFGVLFILLNFIVLHTYAQTSDDCTINQQESKIKRDPVDFIHNHLLKVPEKSNISKENSPKSLVKASKPNSKVKIKLPENTEKKATAAVKLVNEQAKLALQTKALEKKNAMLEAGKSAVVKNNADNKSVLNTTISSIANDDLLNSRLVQKQIAPKKEESSFFNSNIMEWIKDKYSCMIDVLPNQISNVMLYHFIDEWYGVKYRMGGTSKKGVDCSAFVQNLYKYVFGLDLLRTAYSQFNSSELIKNPADLKEGDLVFFKVKSSRISHVGVYLRNNFFVHSASSKGVSIANLTNVYWSRYFAGGGRIKS